MIQRLTRSLRDAPATVPALVAVMLFGGWATDQAGYPLTHWAPGAIALLALLAIALALVRLGVAEVPVPVRIALGCLAAYTALSFLSIAWADVPGEAWEGADRTLLYLLVFALFACWRQHGASATLLLGAWTAVLIGVAAFTALHLDTAGVASLQRLIPGGRLVYPSGYANANAAQWLMAFWPAVLLARSERVPWAVRGALAGGAVLLAQIALLSQSRGSLYATPVMLVLVFALIPGRMRTFALLVPIAVGIGVGAPAVLAVGDHLKNGNVTPAAVHSALAGALAGAVGVGLAVALAAALEARRDFSEVSRRRIRAGVRASAAATLVAVLIGALAVAGNPLARIERGWASFKGGYGAHSSTGSRLVSGLGSNRYDFYRVALDEFLAHPLVGIGAENFQQQYLVHGRSNETPHYPHSVELRTLSETGLLGAALAIVGLGAALLTGARALRRPDPLARAVAGAALSGFAYWVLHGSFDWFWEFAGLGAPAFALLGLACALAPAKRVTAPAGHNAVAATRAPAPAQAAGAGARARGFGARARLMALAVGVPLALAAAASLAAPWLSELQVQSAARVWTQAPRTAYARLNDAASLNPLSDEAYLVAGSIALRYGELAHAEREFSRALARSDADAYATLELGAIASARGDRPAALRLLSRAARLNPRDALTRQVLSVVRDGRRVSLDELNRSILLRAEQLA